MKLQILQENLLKALIRTGRIVSPRPQLPVAQNALLKAARGGLEITTTNLETTETVWAGAKVDEEGGLCVSSRLLTEYVASLPAETIRLVVVEGALRAACAGFSAAIPGMPAAEFPPVLTAGEKPGAKIEKDGFVAALSQALFAAATDEGRPVLTGVRVTREEEETVLAATDGYRLSVKRVRPSLGEGSGAIIPARTLAEVVRVAQEEKETRELWFGPGKDNQATFVIGDTRIVTRLIDGEYPDFRRIIPKLWTTRALFDKEAFVRAVKSAAIFARESANIVRITLEAQRAVVSANAPGVGENRVEVEAKIDGEGGEIAFNGRFLLEFLANFHEEEFLFEMTGALNPGVFRPVKDESYLHIIMPVRVQG